MQRTIIIGGREITTEALGQPIDSAFDRLHEAYFGNLALPWQEFSDAALQFFDGNPTPSLAHDAYFNTFTVIWQNFLNQARYDDAEHIWGLALQPAQQWEQARPGRRVHKGTPYYFWAMTTLLRGDTDKGYLLIHQAVYEDVRTSGQQTPDTPGYALVSLNYARVAQAFRPWVLEQAAFLNDLITNYTTAHHRTLTIEDVKHRFLDTPPTTETVFLLTYTLARLIKLAKLPNHIVNNPFAGQLELNLLFDITLVIDAAIKAKNLAGQHFSHHAEHLLSNTGERLTGDQIGDINGQFRNSFDTALRAALDGTLTLQSGAALSRLQCDVALAYGLRNHGAHNTGTAATIWNRFPEVQQSLFRVLFAAIDHLY
ncbi:MAG: hypothetical protein Q8N47_05690 [Bryobacterales bacterium]|nr:hypothetical protein [Bryobacterales bacterium]